MNVEMVFRDVHNMKIDGVIENIAVDDESICKALISDTNGIILLGVGRGKTQIKLWLTSSGQSTPTLQFIDVAVNEPWAASSQQHTTTFSEAAQSIAELFPTAKIALRSNENGSLTIYGRSDSEEQAKQIASLVRKMFLVPVQDRIAVAPLKSE
jgi:Flp pilus assembly secretin CpaC